MVSVDERVWLVWMKGRASVSGAMQVARVDGATVGVGVGVFIAGGGRMEGVVSVSEGVWRVWLV